MAERVIYQPRVSLSDRAELDLAALRGANIAGSRKSHNSVLCRQRIEAAMPTWFSLIRDITLSKVQSKRGSKAHKKPVFFDQSWYRPMCAKFIDGIPPFQKGDWIKVRSNSGGNSSQMPAHFMREADWTKWQKGELKWEHIAVRHYGSR